MEEALRRFQASGLWQPPRGKIGPEEESTLFSQHVWIPGVTFKKENRHSDWKENLYDRLAGDDEGRVCVAISDEACRETPGNFFRTLGANALSNVGDRLASAKTTLPWLLSHLGAPAWTISLLVPIREAGSMLPQLLIGPPIQRRAVRKWIWAGGSVAQGFCVGGMGWTAMALEGLAAALLILILLTGFSLARAASSIAYKDVLGKTIPKTRRGRLSGWISAMAGLAAMLVGIGFGFLPEADSPVLYAGLLGIASLLWLLAAVIYSRIIEFPGETESGPDGTNRLRPMLTLLRDDVPFRRFVIARALALGSALAAPFYVALAREELGHAAAFLGIFIAVEGVAGLISAPLWGRWADNSSRMVFSVSCALAALCSLAVAGWSWFGFSSEAAHWFYPIAFLGLGTAHAGVRLGRKTYLIDLAEGNKRTDYVAVSNSVIGALLLLSGLAGALTAVFSVHGTIVLFAMAGLAGSFLSLRWKEVSGQAPDAGREPTDAYRRNDRLSAKDETSGS